jgi:syntaxin-binding protein 1
LIVNHSGLLLTDSEIQAMTNLSMLGVRQSISYRDKAINPYAHRNRGGSRDETFDHCRFIPAVKSVIEDQVAGVLSSELFPYVTDPIIAPPRTPDSGGPPLLRNTKPSWATRKSVKEAAPKELRANGPKVILFMIGGITYSEMRSVYEVMADRGREVIIGMLYVDE